MVQKTKKKQSPFIYQEAYQKVMMWFFSFPSKEVSLTELSSILRISKTTANTVVTRLLKEGFLRSKIIGRAWLISSDSQHPYNFTRKIAYNLVTLYEAGIVEAVHHQSPNARVIVLFGSYRKGDDTEESDVDLAVEIIGQEDPKIVPLGTIDVGYRKDVHVNLYTFSRRKVDLNLFANIVNGIVLAGFLEAKP
ncbi:nucleotidyltransferase domain-containing protein [Candidatus Woesearchaeota archaeon]|nr:nucleotidyltransferase domain-containing protein [Candidatus Woesearchaeota archaeon]